MPETITFIRSKEEEYDAVKSEEEEKKMIVDPTGFVNGNNLMEAEPLKRRKKRKRRKKKAKQYIEFHVAQAQLNVDNSNHREDNCNYRGVEMVRVVKTEITKKDEPQKLEVAAMLKEQIKVANVERVEALAAGDGPNSVVVIDLSSSGSQSDEGNSRYCCGVGQMVPGVVVTGTKKKKDEPQKLEIAPSMLKEQINAANVERTEALAAGNGANSVVVIDLTSSGSQSDEGNSTYGCGVGYIAPGVAITGIKKKKRRRRRKSKIIREETLQAEKHENLETGNFMGTESIEIENNISLRQLLRRPRYFDYPGSSWSLCLRCGEESHITENCTLQKKKKPCYRCASFEHNGKRCRKRSQDYLNCKEIGSHSLEELHDQRLSSISCLRCGDSGHDMFSCGNDYSAEDLKEIQCYVCRSYGHLCCVDFPDSGLVQLSCYNCGQPGHLGSGCPKPCSATNGSKSPALR